MTEHIEKLGNTISLLDNITESSTSEWGLMTPQHMVEHLGMIFYSTSKGIDMPMVLPDDKAATAKARFFGSFLPFDKSVIMPGSSSTPSLSALRYSSLDEAKAKTKAAVEGFVGATQQRPDQTVIHGYFGHMKMTEWLTFHIKHLEHHLMQFGVLIRDEKIKQLEKLIFKISKSVNADTQPQWGRMNAQQMIEHLGVTFLFSTGKFDMPYQGTAEDATKNWEGFLGSNDPWKEVFPGINIGDPRPPRRATIEESKADLASTYVKYMNYCDATPEGINPHLAMGDLNIDQWRQVHVKHLLHHARQFGMEV